MSEVYDHHLQHWLRSFIATLPYNERVQLKNLAFCNKMTNKDQPVFLLSNGSKSSFFGQVTCKNSFACPCCSATIMQRTKTDIACCLDALKPNYYAFMMTFVVPHLDFMSCKETVDILYNTWRRCFLSYKQKRKCKNGNHKYTNPFNKWAVENEVSYHAKVAEYTWGDNGWNPHFHCVFWVPRKYKKSVYDLEKELESFWIKAAEKETAAYWQKHNLHGDAEQQHILLRRVFWASDKGISIYMSKYEAQASGYIAGWGADSEITGNINKKASHEGHFTPYQILEKAAAGDKRFAELYREFMLNVTRKPTHRRREFSRGLLQIAKQWRNTEQYKTIIKKKESTVGQWKVIWWFSASQWRNLCELDYEFPILSNILWLAAHNQPLLSEYLSFYGISAPFKEHPYSEAVLKAFNLVA